MGDLLSRCENDVRERMIWHFLMVHDDYGTRVGQTLGLSADDVRKIAPLPDQELTAEEQQRLDNLGNNNDQLGGDEWGQWTSSVEKPASHGGGSARGYAG